MKKIGIITISDDNNYGNRLQNYATQEIVKKLNFECFTLKNHVRCNQKSNRFKIYITLILKESQDFINRMKRISRYKNFKTFNKNVKFYKKIITSVNAKKIEKQFKYFICGSDQIWNLTFRRSTYIDMLDFTSDNKKIAFSPSFGVSDIDNKYGEDLKKSLLGFKFLSTREDAGRDIIEKFTGRKDVEVLIDPTMLLTSEEWDKVSKKPKMLKTDKFILNYFLGDLSEKRKKEIDRIAKENNCKVINILDKNDPFYECGPSEFLYLEKNAFLICTDSFHSSVFAILYNRPFIIFNREQEGIVSMNSRIETLLSKFKLENREYNNELITKENLNHDYSEAYKILEKEREKSINFLMEALDIKDDKNER